jgi:hypothetical protein
MNDETWLTAAQAAKILRVTERQVNRYGAEGRLRTQRAGRRVSYLAADVARLADELQVDKRPLPVPRQHGDGSLISPQMARYIQEQSEAQRATANRLEGIERRLSEPARLALPRWLIIGAAILVVLVVLTFILVVYLGIQIGSR